MKTAHRSDTSPTKSVLYDRAARTALGYRDIDSLSVAQATSTDVRLVDVREPDELTGELGHIAGIENVPLATIESKAPAWDKAQELVLVCRSGGRSGRAAAYLASVGFERVMNMTGGMLAWNDARLPVAR